MLQGFLYFRQTMNMSAIVNLLSVSYIMVVWMQDTLCSTVHLRSLNAFLSVLCLLGFLTAYRQLHPLLPLQHCAGAVSITLRLISSTMILFVISNPLQQAKTAVRRISLCAGSDFGVIPTTFFLHGAVLH